VPDQGQDRQDCHVEPDGSGRDSVLERRGIDTVRALAMDAVQRANSGHPGTPMALAPLGHVLFTRVVRFDATAPDWPDRDRFVLSAGHASMLLYSYLHLLGYGLTLDDLREFRQWGSRTPGHPERGAAPGVEVTTGPLGQGFANGVGMAIAERHRRERYGAGICDHRVFAICSDGDLMEGISHESASLAGHLRLGRLVYVYDDNRITIDGPTSLAYSDDVRKRFEGYGWHVVDLGDAAEDLDAIEAGLQQGIAVEDRPSLVVLRSHIGYPSPAVIDTAAAHGVPLGAGEVRTVKEMLGLPVDVEFGVDDDVLAYYRRAGTRGRDARVAWTERVDAWRATEPERAAEFDASLAGRGLEGWAAKLPTFAAGDRIATRNAGKEILGAICEVVPGLIGGGADLTANTGTLVKGNEPMTPESAIGRTIFFGVREHAMAAIASGMALSGTLPYVGTFFVFADYCRAAIRLAALMGSKVAFVFTHDSVGVGEDGPTHQPVEHLAALRCMPDLRVIRPADANEVAHAWRVHIDGDGPTVLVLSRQDLPVLDGTAERAPEGVARGAYTLHDGVGAPDIVLIGTGSEVAVCVAARDALLDAGVHARVVSMPSWDLFAAQDPAYRDVVLPRSVPRLAVEAATTFGWERWADATVGIDRFGASAPGAVALRELGIDPDRVVAAARRLLGR
jgi:transketolase